MFTGGFAWINKDASNVKSKSHIAKVRAHVRNEYRYWKPGDPPRSSKISSETSRGANPTSLAKEVSAGSPASVASFEISISSRDVLLDESSSATSLQSPTTTSSRDSNTPEQTSSASTSVDRLKTSRRKFFDPVRGSESVLEKDSDLRKEYERTGQQRASHLIPSKSANPVKLISDAKAGVAQEPSAPPRRSKHESGKLLREIRDYHMKQAALQNQSLQTSIGGLRDDPFLSFPIESRRSVIEAADYWVNSWAPAQTPAYIKAGSWKPTSDKVFSITTGDEGAFESQVALAQSYLSRNNGKGEEPTKEVLYHQTRALLSLRKHLEAGSVSAGPLLSSLNLLIMSIVHADRKAYDFHRKGLERMIKTPPPNPTTTLLHAVIKGYFVTSCFYFRLLKFQTQTRSTTQILLNKPKPKPSLETNKLIYPTYPLHPALSADISTLPRGFCDLALDLTLPIQLIEVLGLITAWNTLIAPSPASAQSTQGVTVWFSWDDTEKSLDILEQLPRPKLSSRDKHTTIAYPLCLTLMLYSISVHNRFHATKIYVQLVQDAMDAVRLFAPRSRAESECRLWMAVISSGCARDAGAGNARIGTGGLLREVAGSMRDEMMSGGRHRGKVASRKEHQDWKTMPWATVEVIMKRFFWYEHFAANWRMCWEVEDFCSA